MFPEIIFPKSGSEWSAFLTKGQKRGLRNPAHRHFRKNAHPSDLQITFLELFEAIFEPAVRILEGSMYPLAIFGGIIKTKLKTHTPQF